MTPPERPTVALVWYEAHDRGGAERALAELIRALHADFRLVLFASYVQPDLRPLVEWRPVRAPRRPFLVRFLVFGAVAGWRLRRERADVRHVLDAIVPNRADVITVHFDNVDYVRSMRRLAPPGMAPGRRTSRVATRLVGMLGEWWSFRPSRVRVLAAVSERQGRELRRRVPGVPVMVTPNGAETSDAPVDVSAVRRELDLADDDVVALFVGSDFGRKGLGTTLDALAAANAELRRPLKLIVIGRDDLRPYEAQADRLGVRADVRFLGGRDDTHRFYAASDIFVLPTLYETFCLAAYEAARFNLPIVAPAVNGVEELIGDGEAGVLVAPEPASVAAALVRLARDPEERRRMGERGSATSRRFTWRRSAEAVAGVYRQLMRD